MGTDSHLRPSPAPERHRETEALTGTQDGSGGAAALGWEEAALSSLGTLPVLLPGSASE